MKTFSDDQKRLQRLMNSADELLVELVDLQANIKDTPSEFMLREANKLAEKLLEITKQTYDTVCRKYVIIRGDEPDEEEKKIWEQLVNIARTRNGFLRTGNLILLDVGTGYGRDIKYGSKIPGLKIVGIDNSDGFITILKDLEKEGEIPQGSFRKADMRDLSCFPDCSFDIIRYHASLLHLPVIGKGYMADKALSEGHKVLKDNGIVYISVKEGKGLQLVDTQEGLGRMLYQFHTRDSMAMLLKRNSFRIISSWIKPSSRGEHISWLCIIAEKI
jgi:ubiquinone/menaquinone biosynthesis C-methylase UbiE